MRRGIWGGIACETGGDSVDSLEDFPCDIEIALACRCRGEVGEIDENSRVERNGEEAM